MNYKPFDGTISIKDKVTLITGAANGIGKAAALAFAKGGAKLVLIDMNSEVEDYAEKLAEEYPDCDVDFHFGGQPVYYYMISAE